MSKRVPSHLVRLVVTYLLIGLAFIGSSMYAEYVALDIDDQVKSMLDNALPSITKLTEARTAVRHLEATTDAFAEGTVSSREESHERMHRARIELDAALMDYLTIPMFEDERAAYTPIVGDLARLDGQLDAVRAAVDHGDDAAARVMADEQVRKTVEEIDARLRALVDINGNHAHLAAESVAAIRKRTMTVAFGLDAICFALAAMAAGLAVRAVRKYSALAESHAELSARRATELEEFAKRVGHDLVSPLAGLMFCLGAIERRAPADAEIKEALVRARRSVKRSQAMVQSIFEFARSGAQPTAGASADVGQVLGGVVEELAASEIAMGADVKLEPFAPCAVACEPGVLSSIAQNLLGNALKYTKDCADRRVRLHVQEANDRVRIDVTDAGAGLPPELEAKVFEPYVRAAGAAQPGLGLGLATVKRLVEAHHGAVGVVSKPGESCTFWFELPRVASAADAAAAKRELLARGEPEPAALVH